MATTLRVSDVITKVRSIGLVARYQSEYQEFRIDYRRSDARWSEDSAYFTTYRDDAIETAIAMAAFTR